MRTGPVSAGSVFHSRYRAPDGGLCDDDPVGMNRIKQQGDARK